MEKEMLIIAQDSSQNTINTFVFTGEPKDALKIIRKLVKAEVKYNRENVVGHYAERKLSLTGWADPVGEVQYSDCHTYYWLKYMDAERDINKITLEDVENL